MTEKSDSSTSSPGRQSFTATPTDQARTYQAGGDQTITEHHHHTPRGSLKAGMAWSLAGMTILALGTFVGVDMWQRHTASTAAPMRRRESADLLGILHPEHDAQPQREALRHGFFQPAARQGSRTAETGGGIA